MDIESLKEALGDEKFKSLKTYVGDLIGQRDTAREESINGRKTLKAERDMAVARAAKAMERLGVDSDEELESLPDAKGQGEALKQFEARLKRAERERDDAKKAADEASGKYRASLQRAAVAEAVGGHKFLTRNIVESFVGQRLVWEGDDVLFKTDDGKLVPVKDGVAGFAKMHPEQLEPTGTGGAGVRNANAGGGGGVDLSKLSPVERINAARAAKVG